MRFRRLAALVTSAALLHLSGWPADGACAARNADHDAPTAATGVHAMPMRTHAPSAVERNAPAPRAEAPPCETPAHQPGCCEAMSECGGAGAPSGVVGHLVSPTLVRARIGDTRHDAPASFAAAPEPPPPKA